MPDLAYQSGFGNEFQSEALAGALPSFGNNPQRNTYNLVTEQVSGTAFTVPRAQNLRSWLYRKLPSTYNFSEFKPETDANFCSCPDSSFELNPNPLRWKPFNKHKCNDAVASEEKMKNFVFGLSTIAKSRSNNISIHIYRFTLGMELCSFVNSDGDFLIVPQQGNLRVVTEMGILNVDVGEIVVVPRGILFQINGVDETTYDSSNFGYILEVDEHFCLPNLGAIGSNGLANARDFLSPVAWFDEENAGLEHESKIFTIYNKFGGKLFKRFSNHTPYDVVAWHGNYVPYKYDLKKFNFLNSVSFDHPDPSIFTVLTCPSCMTGTALADFAIFGPRWMCAEDTFRPPWYHRNCMSEFMGLIEGAYDAKTGFQPGGASLHPIMTPHGPDVATFKRASSEDTSKPVKFNGGLAFMFETKELLLVASDYLSSTSCHYNEYTQCWHD